MRGDPELLHLRVIVEPSTTACNSGDRISAVGGSMENVEDVNTICNRYRIYIYIYIIFTVYYVYCYTVKLISN